MLPQRQLFIINFLLRLHPPQTLTQALIQIPLKLQQHRKGLILSPNIEQQLPILKNNLQDTDMVMTVTLRCYFYAVFHLAYEVIDLLLLVEI